MNHKRENSHAQPAPAAPYEDPPGHLPVFRYEFKQVMDWYHDRYEVTLPAEPPGGPLPGGPWEIAKRILREYQFSDPQIISHVFFATEPLAINVVLLCSHFLFLTFYLAVRVGRPFDEVRQSNHGAMQVWGYNYQALAPHLERGQLFFEVAKWLESGEVRFRMHVYSRRGHIANPIYRLGYVLLGRWQQKRFGRRALKRMRRLVERQLAATVQGLAPPPLDGPAVCSASADPKANRVMESLRERYGDGGTGTGRPVMVPR